MPSRSSGTNRRYAVIGAAILVIIGLVSVVAIVRMGKQSSASDNSQLMYPGASTVVDLNNPDGGRTVHLQTSDPLAKVESWYQNNLKLTKTMKLTSTSYVLKNDQTTVTLAVENDKTNILIKQRP